MRTSPFFATSLLACSILTAFPWHPYKIASPSPKNCDIQVQPQWVDLRHIEANGVGYNQGYSTLEGFFTLPRSLDKNYIPFLNLRGHIFNDGKLAANTGIGLRYLSSLVWGINAYYDFRQTHHHTYNQVSMGFEILGKVWDFRWNGYFPLGEKTSGYYNTQFHSFRGNNFYISRKREIVLTGTNAEWGAHFKGGKHLGLYTAAGPYYLTGEGRQTWGGKARLSATIYDCLGLQLSGSYDSIYHGIIQGELTIRMPLGGKKSVPKRAEMTCARDTALRQRAYQRIDRNEIIVASHKYQKSLAINPATGLPWVIWFVDNTSHSQGTFESPYNQLSQAISASSSNEAIIILTGDGTDNGLNAGNYQLKNGQRLLGGGITHDFVTTKGTVTAPALSQGLPLLSNTFNNTVIQLATNNEISGLCLNEVQGLAGISGSGTLGDILITQNSIVLTQMGSVGISIGNLQGTVTIDQCSFLADTSSTTGISLGPNSVTNAYVTITNNFYSGTSIAMGITLANSSSGFFRGLVANNTAIAPSAGSNNSAFTINALSTAQLCITLRNNNMATPSGGNAGYAFTNLTSSPTQFSIDFDTNNIGAVDIPNNPVSFHGCGQQS